MQDDQWPYSPNRGGQRERASEPPTGSPAQRPGRPPNGASPGSNGRSTGQINYSSGSQPRMPAAGNQRPSAQRPGTSGQLSRPQSTGREDGWGPSGTSTYQPRRPSGPINPSAPPGGGRPTSDGYQTGNPAGRRPSGPTGPGGQRTAGRGQSWEDEEQRWLGPENARPSRSVSSPLDVPGAGRQGTRGASAQRNGSGAQRSWAGQDDYDNEDWTPSGRPLASPGQRRSSGSLGSGRSGKGQAAGTTTRNAGWVVETPARKPANPLRTRLLVSLLLLIVVLGGAIAAVPSVRQRVLAHIPGLGSSSSNQPTGNTGTLSLQVNVPTAKVTVDNQTVAVQPGQNGGFATATLDGLSVGSHALTIHADNFADFTGSVAIKAGPNPWVAWLAPSADALTAAIQQFSPATQPGPGAAGDHYLSGTKVAAAAGALTVSISYTLNGLDPKAFTSQLPQGSDTTKSPFQPATVTLVPVVTFKDGNGKTLSTYSPTALPVAQFALQMVPETDDKGAVQISATGITLKSSGGQDVTTDFSGPAKNDYALYYAIAAVLPASPANALTFKCIGAVDNTNFNPEDGLQIFETANDAHYFYRWGILWATNPAAHTLTPNAPQAPGGSNEFNDANTAHANGSCGS